MAHVRSMLKAFSRPLQHKLCRRRAAEERRFAIAVRYPCSNKSTLFSLTHRLMSRPVFRNTRCERRCLCHGVEHIYQRADQNAQGMAVTECKYGLATFIMRIRSACLSRLMNVHSYAFILTMLREVITLCHCRGSESLD